MISISTGECRPVATAVTSHSSGRCYPGSANALSDAWRCGSVHANGVEVLADLREDNAAADDLDQDCFDGDSPPKGFDDALFAVR
jgi:hypothetical protein